MLNSLRKIIPQNSFLRRWYSATNAYLAASLYGFPGEKMTIIGITGTDGKTTTTELVAHILRENGKKVFSASSARLRLHEEILDSKKRTTPSPWILQKLLKKAKNKCDIAVIEVSSHALSQARIAGVYFDATILTNITPEHLDYYHTFFKYQEAKKLLFTKYQKKNAISILNSEDEAGRIWAKEFLQKEKKVITYGENGDAKISKIKTEKKGISFYLETRNKEASHKKDNRKTSTASLLTDPPTHGVSVREKIFNIKLTLPLFGTFNAYNATAAILAAKLFGISTEDSAKALKKFSGVPGRMQKINEGQDFTVYVDFALTPGALEKLLISARKEITSSSRRESEEKKNTAPHFREKTSAKKIHLVFGCTGGDHDHEKRPEMGKIAAKLADHVIVTDDETYSEEGNLIRKDIFDGIREAFKKEEKLQKNFSEKKDSENTNELLTEEKIWETCKEIPDRKIAIETALQSAAEGDIVIISGMGHLESRNMGGKEIKWSDEKIVRDTLKTFKIKN